MPLITIHALPPKDPNNIKHMIADVQMRGAQALQCGTNNIWVMFQPVISEYYSQGEADDGLLKTVKIPSPIVTIRAQAGRSETARELFVKAVADAVAHGISVSANDVWIHYQEMNPKDVWFEGHWAG